MRAYAKERPAQHPYTTGTKSNQGHPLRALLLFSRPAPKAGLSYAKLSADAKGIFPAGLPKAAFLHPSSAFFFGRQIYSHLRRKSKPISRKRNSKFRERQEQWKRKAKPAL
ncbi:MAG: hypothetical protein IJP07_04135 [Firmicutes bacterium]|nr:hypothetical protein [Bacillota bacterium]